MTSPTSRAPYWLATPLVVCSHAPRTSRPFVSRSRSVRPRPFRLTSPLEIESCPSRSYRRWPRPLPWSHAPAPGHASVPEPALAPSALCHRQWLTPPVFAPSLRISPCRFSSSPVFETMNALRDAEPGALFGPPKPSPETRNPVFCSSFQEIRAFFKKHIYVAAQILKFTITVSLKKRRRRKRKELGTRAPFSLRSPESGHQPFLVA